jgi:uncharacterized membrane protein YvbJ
MDAMNCPKCGVAVGATTEQCPQCGILFSKWQERELNVASGNMARYSIANATSSGFNWTILAIFCIAIVTVFYYVQLRQ